ncbi:hypothetical protein BKA82DRAFT_750493 [Pisolithus tinctorius]|uniref:G domain-containing protein n=1 Tax=Pisolithus tinctorius Marx 270 TaxID=870435 RepID=A0A0C3JSV8_PISTI|nr:hypothetical protein BKA82DRAFT_750493 [Pisolithus tinctorius]KIO12228.1 hypothetical protein M404DRAFT_750493 [Pisolithus tinctorius Marx 270]
MMASLLKLSYIELQNAQGIESVKLQLNGSEYSLARSQEKSDTFSKAFDKPLTLETEPLALSVSRKRSWFSCCGETVPETITFRSVDVRSKLDGQEFHHVWGKVSIKLRFLPQTQSGVMASSVPAKSEAPQPITEQPVVTHSTPAQDTVRSAGTPVPANIPPTANTPPPANIPPPANTIAPANREGLRPTTEDLIRQCPRFRVLVVGKSGVGKSTLINRIFGVNTANVAKDKPGEADIEQEFTSPENDRLILHDSKGFEAGDAGNYDTVKSFIVKRKKEPKIKDQLHAVWLCFQIPIPTYGERLLEDAAEAFLKIRKEVLGDTPTIVVFTKHDRLVSFMRQRMPNDPEAGQRYLQEECVQQINDFTGENIAHVAVSSKPRYEHELRDLISLTQDMVSMSFTSPGNEVSPVPLAAAGAQRMLPILKVQLSIAVGRQRYWRVMGASANFPGYTMQDCLRVIHNDIVAVWNFYDPCQYLNSEEFRKVMMNMVERADPPASPSRIDTDTLAGGVPLIALAPVMLPLNAFFTLGKWVFAAYQGLQGVPTKFMAYIVDLTHVLEILFALTAEMRAKKLTRTAIKIAYKAYLESEWMTHTHTDIRYFRCSAKDRDDVLDKITSMIPSGDREDRVSRALQSKPSVDLGRDEEWTSEEVSQ